jgi:hypothetical protein
LQFPSSFIGESLKRLLQGTDFGAVASVFIGFNWGGWAILPGSKAGPSVAKACAKIVVTVK